MDSIDAILHRLCANVPLYPTDFTAVLLTLLTNYFSSPDNILHPALKDYIYTPDDNSRIIIQASGLWNPRSGDTRPAILVSRGPWQVQPPSLGMGLIQGTSPETYLAEYVGVHNIICIGKTPAAADLLGGEVLHFIVQILPYLRSRLPVAHITVNGLSEPKPLDEGRIHYAVTIPIQYAFDIRWSMQISTTTPTP